MCVYVFFLSLFFFLVWIGRNSLRFWIFFCFPSFLSSRRPFTPPFLPTSLRFSAGFWLILFGFFFIRLNRSLFDFGVAEKLLYLGLLVIDRTERSSIDQKHNFELPENGQSAHKENLLNGIFKTVLKDGISFCGCIAVAVAVANNND